MGGHEPACIVNKEGDTLDKLPVYPILKLTVYLSFLFLSLSEHKVVFLMGSKGESCSGMVGIAKGNETYWLSGSNETWNEDSANAVCRQMLCGEAKSFKSSLSTDMRKDVWKESYSCSSNSKSLFACNKTTQPSDHYNTIATVNCSGNVRRC